MEMIILGTYSVKLKNLITTNSTCSFFFLHVATIYVKLHVWFALYLYRTDLVSII